MTELATAAPAPLGGDDRIHALDILRGFALWGMIVVHFHQRVNTEAAGLEGLIGWVTWVGIEAKSWATFAFLFGVGFAVLMRRLESRQAPAAAFYLRRLLVLALLGIVAEAAFVFQGPTRIRPLGCAAAFPLPPLHALAGLVAASANSVIVPRRLRSPGRRLDN